MKLKTIILSLFIGLIVYLPVSAQLPGPKSEGDIKTPVSQCGDKFDNDGDKLIDTDGVQIDGKKVNKDPQCINGALCEDGTTTCTKSSVDRSSGATDFNLQVAIKNPLKVDTISGAIALFMNAVLRIALPFIIVFFIWSGVSFVLARGNPEKIKTAKNMFWYTIIGTLLILGAWAITNAIIGTVNSITS
jgi:hypothetical protein